MLRPCAQLSHRGALHVLDPGDADDAAPGVRLPRNERPRVSLLTVHLWVGVVVAILAVLAVWRRPERRVTLYVVTLQVLLGIVLMIQGLRISPIHPLCAIVGWAGYMAANAVARRRPGPAGLVIAGVSSLFILAAFAIGEMVAHAPPA